MALMLSFRAKFEPVRAAGLDVTIGFRFGAESFRAGVRDGALTTERGESDSPDVQVTGSPPAVAGLVYGKVPLAALTGQGALTVAGDAAALMRFADLFEMPQKAGA